MRSNFDELSEAMYLTSGFVYDSAAQAEATFAGTEVHYQYSRFGNPTVSMLEGRLAALEGAEACRATATGMAAVHASMLSHLKAGDRVVASRALFGSCHWIVSTLLPRYGVATEFVDGSDLAQWRAALSRPATMVLLETPSNPMLEIVDLRAVCDLAHQAGALVVVDNVFATPLLQKPMEFGADIVVYSATKHFDGQGRTLGGAVLGSQNFIKETLLPFHRHTGPALSSFNAWIIFKALETYEMRMERHCANAKKIAEFLEGHSKIQKVYYPELKSHKQFNIAQKQMKNGGTMITLETIGDKKTCFNFMNALQIIDISNNLGDSKSLITHPSTTTHSNISLEDQKKIGINETMCRLSVGLESVDDLINDLKNGLDKI
jgi:O-succinylhomoserine sulfhydrylase